jgi:hypothetical protein
MPNCIFDMRNVSHGIRREFDDSEQPAARHRDQENSYVRVGFTDGIGASEGDTGRCVIQGDGGHGIRIQRASSARIYTNTITITQTTA